MTQDDIETGTGFAVMLSSLLWSWVFVATFWSVEGAIIATVFSIIVTIYLDRLQGPSVEQDDHVEPGRGG